MSKHNTRNRVKSFSDSCSTCCEKILKNESSFDCFCSGCRMYLNEDCTGLSEAAVNGVPAQGKNALLIRKKCVKKNHQDKWIKAAQKTTTSKEFRETQMKTLENEMFYLKKTVIKIKTLLTTKQLDSDHPTQASLISSRQEPPQGTRRQSPTRHPWINGEVSKIVQRTRSRRSSKVLTHINVYTLIGDVIHLNQFTSPNQFSPLNQFSLADNWRRKKLIYKTLPSSEEGNSSSTNLQTERTWESAIQLCTFGKVEID